MSVSSHLEKMICRILLFFYLASCGMLQPRYSGPVYQTEENHNITAEWRFSSEPNISVPSLKIHCVSVPGLKVFYHLDNSVDEPQHEQFSGRVQCDRDALRTGRVRLHVSRVRTEDSGLYLCRMATGSGRKVSQFSLKITARDWPKTERPNTEKPERLNTVRRGGIDVFTVLILMPGLVAVLFALYLVIHSLLYIH
ncbi:programmed cell death 1 ligand 1-like isoform X2 [Acanthopagrus latus]|uniref:programmed cell death 1 ligand 1-like isoform X2 n=1 Tax=Acanthopagrus latus TaxID=8177 RepID=UPI00187BF952|nr:programmed cell death 1 ligand 1-like isoform X2 [Acanthopagrus latus]